MPIDPYGFETDQVEAPVPATPATHALAGVSTLAWLSGAVAWCGCCSGVQWWQPPEQSSGWTDSIGVWLILTLPAWVLLGVSLGTAGLHALGRRWWTSVGPNVVVGGGVGCAVWGVVFLLWVILDVVMSS